MDDLTTLAADLLASAAQAPKQAASVVAKGALNVKTQARSNAAVSAGAHAKLYPGTITYDMSATGLSAEIGPEARGQGNLGVLEYGSAHNPPHRDLGRALDVEEPRFVEALAAAVLPWA